MCRRLLILLAILATTDLSLPAQSSRPGTALRTGTIVGRVVDTAGEPVAGARLYTACYSTARPEEHQTESNERGDFTLNGLSACRYKVDAQKHGYHSGQFPVSRADGQTLALTLADGERREITIVMPKFAVVTGIVTDDVGVPLSRVSVYAVPQTVTGPSRLLRGIFGEPCCNAAETDEMGRYRIENVVPGTYFIQTRQMTRPLQRLSGGRVLLEPVTFASGVAGGADGQALKIEFGDLRAIDISLRRVIGVAVRGLMQPAAPQIRLTLLPQDTQTVSETDPRGIPGRPAPDGSFEFPVVAAGDYTLDAITIQNVTWDGAIHQNVALGVPTNLQPTMWARLPVTVGATPLDNVTLPLRPGLRVIGRMEFSGAGVRPDPTSIREAYITFSRADGGRLVGWQIQISVDGDGKFVAAGLTPGQWQVNISILGDWTLKSALLAGQDVTNKPFTVAVSDLGELVLTFGPRRD